VEVINQGVAELQAMGVHAIVALVHQGGEGSPGGGSVRGTEITRIAEGIDPDVDVIVSGHSHRGYQGFIAGKLVTQAYAYGTAIADIRLTIDRGSGDVTDKSAAIVTTYADRLPPDPYVQAWVDAWRALVQPLVDRVVGVAAERIVRNETPGEESAIGNLVSDAFRAATGAQIACLNAGGDRADIPAGPVTWGKLFEVQPFGNELVTLLLTGAQIERVLNEQWANQPNPFVMKCSGMVYTWDAAEPDGARVTLAEVALAGGTPLQADGVYTFTVNDFLADGDQNFTVFLESPLRLPGPVDVDALIEYVERLPQPFTMRVEGRINRRN
jgi:5'-nucleotidase